MDESTHFLGRAMACVVLPHLGGDGPSLGSHQLQREIVAGQVRKLLEVAGPSGKGLLRMNPDHELIIGISGKSIDNNSLSQDSKGPFDNVRFTDAAKSTKSTLFAGQHRIETLNQLLQDTIKELKRVKARLVEQPENITIENLHTELFTMLQEKGRWLVAFYDLGKPTSKLAFGI